MVADKAAKETVNMPGMALTKLLYIDYFLLIRKAITLNGKTSGKPTSKLENIKPRIKSLKNTNNSYR